MPNINPSQFLRWDPVVGASSYEVERFPSGTLPDFTAFPPDPEISGADLFAGLTTGTFRNARVRATDPFGVGPWSVNIGLTLVSGLVAPANLHVE